MKNTDTKMKKKILVADDDAGIVDALQMILGEFDYEVETTMNGNDLMELEAKDYQPDLILLDIWMSGMDGRDICKHLKSKDSTKHIPVIIVSANKDIRQIAADCGADDYLAKPFDMKVLLGKIDKFLGDEAPRVGK